jgi:lysophospholipase L1-like esterase
MKHPVDCFCDLPRSLKLFAVVIAILWLGFIVFTGITGCGVSGTTTENANFHRFSTDTVQNPSVLIVGDSIVNAWCSAALLAQNPTWACQGSPQGVTMETSTEVLARFQKALAASPRTVVIEAGIWDMQALTSPDMIGADPCTVSTACQNIQAMILEAQNAGISVIVCTIPPWGMGPAATWSDDSDVNLTHVADIDRFNTSILADATPQVIAIDMYTLLAVNAYDQQNDIDDDIYAYQPSLTADGVNPNTAGGQVMTAALQAALSVTANQAERR